LLLLCRCSVVLGGVIAIDDAAEILIIATSSSRNKV
jgi:hypothetical protein